MTITVTTVSNNQSFGGWLATTNRLANIASQNTVTVDYTSGGSLSTGNGYVNGYFGANNIYVAAGLSGGNISSNGVLNIVSNTAFKYSSSNLVVLTANSTQSVLTINVDTVSITGNTIFANTISIGNSTVNSVINSTSITANAVTFNTISVGNSTVNSVINSTSLASINSTSITSNSITANVIIANGSFGTANQVLSSNGTSLYWGDVAAGATFVRQTFTANSTVNTTFTITNGYTVNAIDVYENGIKLIVGTEVTANNGTSITLATSALNGSTVDVVGLLSASIYSLNINTVSQGFAFSWTNNHVFNALVDFSTGSNIASAATINLNTATSNRVHITGTTAITAVTLTRGPRTVIFDDVLTLTHNATTNNLPGAANITTAAGDRAIYESDGTTVYCVSYTRASGTAVTGSSITTTETITGNTTLTAASAGYQYIAMTVLGRSITLPDATTVTIGSPKFYFDNTSGGYPVGIRNSAGTLLMSIAAGGAATVSCQSISSAAGVWSITGRNLEPGLITIDNTFSSTYLSTVFKQFVAFDSAKSLHFLELSSGFAAVAVDNTTGAVGTPVTVSATASAIPRTAFMITSTTAIVFYSSTTGTLISVVISLSGATTLTVGTASSTLTAAGAGVEDFSAAPKIAQLASTLYLVSYATATGAGTTSVAAFQVSGGTTVTLGSAVNIIATNNVIDSTTTYALTATTGLVIYLSGAASPYTISAVVVSVTNANPPVCTVGTPAAGGTRADTAAPASCLLSSTKALITPDTNNTIVGAQAFTISGTSVSVGAVLTVETIASYSGALRYIGEGVRGRYNPVLFPLTATTALFSYTESTARTSRAVILTESSGTMTKGTILFNSISSGVLPKIGMIVPQGTTEFIAMKSSGSSTDSTLTLLANSHKISGTSITTGLSTGALSEAGATSSIGSGSTLMIRLTTGVYVIGNSSGGGNAGPLALCVMKSSGDAIDYRGAIRMPDIRSATFSKKLDVSSNRIVILSNAIASTIADVNGLQIRLLNIEIAS